MCLQADLFTKTFSCQLKYKMRLEIFLMKLIHMKITKLLFRIIILKNH